jgi:hypothetical protein
MCHTIEVLGPLKYILKNFNWKFISIKYVNHVLVIGKWKRVGSIINVRLLRKVMLAPSQQQSSYRHSQPLICTGTRLFLRTQP